MKYFRSTKVQILIIILATFLAYLNIFQNGFVVDDEDFIVNWKEKQEITNVPLMLKGNNPPKFGGIYRPIRGVLYTFYDQIFGANPFGYHLHSILVHLGVTVLVYFITRQLIQGLGSRGWGLGLEVKTKKNSTIPYTLPQRGKLRLYPIPFISALLFGLHPIHTESITFMTSSMDMTGVFFMLAALHLYLIEKKMYSYIFAILAFFSYEPALVLIPLLVTYDVLIKKIPLRETLSNIKKYLPYLLAGLSFIFIRLVLIGRNPAHFKYLADSFYHTQLIMTKVFVKYLSLLIAPFNLSLNHIIDPDFETFNPPVNDFKSFTSQSILDPWVITSILIIATLIFITIKFRNKLPLVSFGLAWIFISFLPYANLVPQPTPLAERYLYIASFGFCLLLGYLLVEISNFKFQISNYFLFTLFFLLFSFYFYQTYQRNKDWKEKGSLWQRALVYYPNSAFASYIMARVNQEKGNLPEAIKFYNQTANLQPGYVTAYLELGRLYHKNNQLDKALEVLVKATQLELEPIDENRLDASIGELAKVYTEIGFIYREKKKFKEAYTNFEQALSLYSGYLPAKVSIETLLKDHPELNELAKIYSMENWTEYHSKSGLSFQYPKIWDISENDGQIHIFTKDKSANIEIIVDGFSTSKEEYLKNQTDMHGMLVNQRYTRLPNADNVYAKIWNDPTPESTGSGVPKLQFYVFKPKNVIKLFVYPAEISLKVVLDSLMRSLKLTI